MEIARVGADEHDEVTQGAFATAHLNASQSPFLSFQLMESLLEKLKLLNYEQFFCQPNRIKGLSKIYFAISTNPGDQFNTFVSLAAWLINQSGISIETPQEFDDPNATVANILDSLRSLVGQASEFPPSKLKSGSGEYIIHVLDLLADAALKYKRIRFEPPQINEEADEASTSSNAAEEATISISEDGDLVEWTGGKTYISRVTSELRSGIICDSEIDAETGDDDDNDLTAVDIDRKFISFPFVIILYPNSGYNTLNFSVITSVIILIRNNLRHLVFKRLTLLPTFNFVGMISLSVNGIVFGSSRLI